MLCGAGSGRALGDGRGGMGGAGYAVFAVTAWTCQRLALLAETLVRVIW